MISVFYAKWFAPFYPSAPDEPGLDCNACLMVKPPKGPRRDEGPFKADLKCCTYLPFTTNVALGSKSLTEKSGWPVRWAEARARGVLTPLGLIPPSNDMDRGDFGRDAKLLCPFYDNGGCAIWDHRSAVCANYVCMSKAGEEGLAFWAESEELGNRLEWALAHLVLWQIGFTTTDTDAMSELAASGDRAGAAASFGEWVGREEELFAKCRQVADGLDTDAIMEILGDDEELLMVSLQKRRSQM
ncbi:MAG: hypothetical protein V4760_00785 [Bdellovibrionota bacterium]